MDGNIEISFDGSHLSIVGQGLDHIPEYLGKKYGENTKQLDLSDNNLKFVFMK